MVLKQASQIAPDSAEIAAEQGRTLLQVHRPAEALLAFGRALALDPGDARALNNWAPRSLHSGKLRPAQADFEQALARDPCQFDARLNLARLGIRKPAGPAVTPASRSRC